MADPSPRVQRGFRRMFESLGASRRELVVPHIEQVLYVRGRRKWPKSYEVRVRNKESVFDGYFHPSRHAEAPPLQLYYEFHPEHRERLAPESIGRDMMMTLAIGSAIHAVVQSLMIKAGLASKDQVEHRFVNEARRCSGEIDVREVVLPDGVRVVVEIKSAGWLPAEPPPEHRKQARLYLDSAFTDDERPRFASIIY